MIRLHAQHIRTQLTVRYIVVLAAVLVLYSGAASLYLLWHLRDQLDHYAVQDLETVEGLLSFDAAGRLQLREDYHNHPESKQVQERLLEVLSADGAVLYRNARLGARDLGGPVFAGEGQGGYSPRTARLADGTRLRLVSREHRVEGRPTLIRLAYSEEPLWRQFEELLGALLLMMPITLALAGLAGYGLARRALAPLDEMAQRAERITADQLDARLPIANPEDELGRLAGVFNHTLARLEQSFEQLRRFTADASHELRTPLASIRSVGEVGLQKDGSREEYREVIGSMLEEVNRLTRLVDALLTMSRADAGQLKLRPTVFPLMELAREAAALFEVLTEEKGQQLVIHGDEQAVVEGDRLFLRQAVVNILHNAVKYTPAHGRIAMDVRTEAADGRVAITIADSGPGIPADDCARVFDRFYRVDSARTRDAGGAGLGLSIAKWAVEANGGRIRLDSVPGTGCTFRLELPAVVAHN